MLDNDETKQIDEDTPNIDESKDSEQSNVSEQPAPIDENQSSSEPAQESESAETKSVESKPAESKPTESDNDSYCVLARKYRPNDFDTLIGQDALVRTLSNALRVGRIAQSFMLTGVRGVGKTTTARIIAKALNCNDTDENGNPPVKPCGSCDNCNAIADGSHIDVVEMDAASHTSIDDIREIIESTQYTPTMGRYKIYILDEVHMLSKNAFNGLLKTLEEPPAHVKFIFATTEIGKVPVTILSRCQRFDLRRVSAGDLYNHYSNISKMEGFNADDEAIRTIARCADGSVRDGLSILDQALALSENKNITNDLVNGMLGLADRSAIYELFELLMAGENVPALTKINELYGVGAEPIVILQELLDISWLLTRFKVNPQILNDPATPEIEKNKGGEMAGKLTLPTLTATWQILNKGLGEMKLAENQIMTLEMIAVRLMYASDLPSPADLVKKLIDSKDPAPNGGGVEKPTQPTEPKPQPQQVEQPQSESQPEPTPKTQQSNIGETPPPINAEPPAPTNNDFNLTGQTVDEITPPQSYTQVVEWLKKKTPLLGHKFQREGRPVESSNGKFVVNINLEQNDKKSIHKLLTENFGESVIIEYTNTGGGKTLAEIDNDNKQATHDRAEQTQLVQSVKQHFPDAVIKKIDLTEGDENNAG